MYEALKQKLIDQKVHLSHQRLHVLKYLAEHPCHPTVEQIYSALKEDMPTLSKTTVYNTLRFLTEQGIVRVVGIEDHETRYDLVQEDHGHFKCEICGKIIDFPIDMNALRGNGLQAFQITDKHVYFKGVCPDCLSDIKPISQEEKQ